MKATPPFKFDWFGLMKQTSKWNNRWLKKSPSKPNRPKWASHIINSYMPTSNNYAEVLLNEAFDLMQNYRSNGEVIWIGDLNASLHRSNPSSNDRKFFTFCNKNFSYNLLTLGTPNPPNSTSSSLLLEFWLSDYVTWILIFWHVFQSAGSGRLTLVDCQKWCCVLMLPEVVGEILYLCLKLILNYEPSSSQVVPSQCPHAKNRSITKLWGCFQFNIYQVSLKQYLYWLFLWVHGVWSENRDWDVVKQMILWSFWCNLRGASLILTPRHNWEGDISSCDVIFDDVD